MGILPWDKGQFRKDAEWVDFHLGMIVNVTAPAASKLAGYYRFTEKESGFDWVLDDKKIEKSMQEINVSITGMQALFPRRNAAVEDLARDFMDLEMRVNDKWWGGVNRHATMMRIKLKERVEPSVIAEMLGRARGLIIPRKRSFKQLVDSSYSDVVLIDDMVRDGDWEGAYDRAMALENKTVTMGECGGVGSKKMTVVYEIMEYAERLIDWLSADHVESKKVKRVTGLLKTTFRELR